MVPPGHRRKKPPTALDLAAATRYNEDTAGRLPALPTVKY